MTQHDKSAEEYLQDISEIRSIMERSSRFMSLSGLSGVFAGLYAIAGASLVYTFWDFHPQVLFPVQPVPHLGSIILTAVIVLCLALGTAVYLSSRKASGSNQPSWNAASRHMITSMLFPLFTGGALILILLSKGGLGFMMPLSLIFYGLALVGAGQFTFGEIRGLGLIQIILGLISVFVLQYSLHLWVLGFGIAHIGYGIYMYLRYDRTHTDR